MWYFELRQGLVVAAVAIATNGCAGSQTRSSGACEAAASLEARNRELVSTLIDQGLNAKNASIALELASNDFEDLDAFPNQPPGAEGLKYHFEFLTQAVPDLRVEYDLVAQGNTVIEEWTGRGMLQVDFATGKPLEKPVPIEQNGVTIFEVTPDGKISQRRTFQRGEQ